MIEVSSFFLKLPITLGFEMQVNLSIKSITVQNIYSLYLSGFYLINRRYQRKLVWSIEEKEKFIDSILNGFPIPMILAANYRRPDESTAYEILDGMQRLNAITSFIEGEFPVNSQYFDLEAVAQTKSLKEKGCLHQRVPALSISDCSRVLDYPVPFSVFDENEPTKLDESFRRINTGGRTLSKQDVRQAGSLGLVPELISSAAIYIRKDSSHSNVVDLRNMKNISLGNYRLKYGINIHEVFWAKHGIITHDNIRQSRDEELVAHILSYMADPESSDTSSHYLDSIYDSTTSESALLAKQINKIGKTDLLNQFCFVFDEISKTLDSNAASFKNLIFKGKANKAPQVFQVIFIAFYKVLIKSNLKIINYSNLCNSLTHVFDNHLTSLNSETKWKAFDRERLSDAIFGVIRKSFCPKSGADQSLGTWVASLENILNESKTEQVCYDFKMGFCQITGSFSADPTNVLNKIVKTLVAMTNTKPGECYVIVGVADKEADSLAHETHFDTKSVVYNDFFITGFDAEAKKYHKSVAEFEQKITQFIDREPISEGFKSTIKANLVTFLYEGKQIMLFKAARGAQPERYKNDVYVRTLSHNEKVSRESEFSFFALFQKENALAQKV